MARSPLTHLICALLLMFVFLSPARAQTDDEVKLYQLLTQRQPDCYRLRPNAAKLIPDLYERGQMDSLELVVGYLDNVCADQYFSPFKLLLDIHLNRPHKEWSDSRALEHSFAYYWDYSRSQGYWECGTSRYYGCFGSPLILVGLFALPFIPAMVPFFHEADGFSSDTAYQINQETNPFAATFQNIASKTIQTLDTTSADYLFCLYATGQRKLMLDKLARGEFSGTLMQQLYDATITTAKADLVDGRFNIVTAGGVWIPTGPNDPWGPKMELSYIMGGRWNRWGFDASLGFRLLKSRDEYLIEHVGETYSTDHFFGWYLDAGPTYQFLKYGRLESELFGALGYDWVEVFGDPGKYQVEGTPRLSVGFRQRIFHDHTRNDFVGFQVRYDLCHFDNEHGTKLTNSAISINLIFGRIGKQSAIDRIRRMGQLR